MDLLKKTIENLFEYRKQTKHTKSYKKDLITIACMKIHKYYMILPPTERNIDIVKSILILYPDIKTYSNYDTNDREAINLFSFLSKEFTASESIENTINRLLKNCIVVEKDDNLAEFLEAAKIGNLLIGGKKYVIKQIGFYDPYGPSLSYYDGIANKINNKIKEKKKIKNELQYTNIASNGTITFSMKSTVYLEKDFDINLLTKRSLAIDFKKSIQEDIKNALDFKLPLNYKKISFSNSGSMTLTLSKANINKLFDKNWIYRRDLGKIGMQFYESTSGKNSIETFYSVTGIDLEDFQNYSDKLLKN